MEILITTVDQTNDGVAFPADEGYKRGGLIAVVPDGHPWGREESVDAWMAAGRRRADFPNLHFAIVELPGEPVDLDLLNAEYRAATALDAVADEPGGFVDERIATAKNAWHVDLDGRVPADTRRALDRPGPKVAGDRNWLRLKYTDSALPPRLPDAAQLPQRLGSTPRTRT